MIVQTKQTRCPSKNELIGHAGNITVHADICGPLAVATHAGKRYFLTLTATPQSYDRVYLLKSRPQIAEHCLNFIEWLNRNFCHRVKQFHSDNAAEVFTLKKKLNRLRVEQTTSLVYTPRANGVAERMNLTLLTKARAMLHEAGMNDKFWGEASLTAAYTQNRIITPVLNMKTAMEMLLEKAPDNSRIKIFGCTAFVTKHKAIRKGKLSNRTEAGVNLGPPDGAFTVRNPSSWEVVHTRHVTFDECIFPLSRNR